ncbi:MAG TPA: low molecular weight protein-tyrosine-phosphatase [Mycobacteriales bacterium]|nr:low molecular weight protein-tyrosine-phosphatase [Mycobacteriales bacterium]
MPAPYRICFVCLGNICRSPIAEAVMRSMVEQAGLADRIVIDSAGTGDWHAGGPADPRTVDTLRAHGYDGAAHVARQFQTAWFAERDLVVAMDGKNLQSLRWLAPPDAVDKIVRLRSFDRASRGGDLDVPDPYYDHGDGFERVLAMVEAACAGLLTHVRAQLGLVDG